MAGHGILGLARVEVELPDFDLLPRSALDVIRFQGSLYVASVGGAAVSRLVSDPKTRADRPPSRSAARIRVGPCCLQRPSRQSADQLLAATSDGVMKVVGR